MKAGSALDISVAICTWNRAELLESTLHAMHELRIPASLKWELIIVNNNCTDDTDAVIARHSGRLPIRRVFESKQGHSNARNAAIDAALGELIVWTDDDVLVDSGWLSAYRDATVAWPEAAFFGGPVRPWYVTTPPRWVEKNIDLLRSPYALVDFGDTTRLLDSDEFPVGANMAFRSRLLRESRFDSSLGRVGNCLISGDEVEMMRRLRADGATGVWVAGADVQHYVGADRLTGRYIANWCRGYGRTSIRFGLAGKPASTLFGAPRWAIRAYLTSRVLTGLSAPLRGRLWLKNIKRAGYCRGVIEESRRVNQIANAAPRPGASIPGRPLLEQGTDVGR